ncbi:hypothetical protein PGB90_006327 [Kerria lacca]
MYLCLIVICWFIQSVVLHFVLVCTEAVNCKLPLPTNSNCMNTKSAFVTKGFSMWNKTNESFCNHEKSEFHRACISGVTNRQKTSIVEQLSDGKQRAMDEAKVALKKIFDTVRFIARKGLPFRGNYDKKEELESSQFMKLLEMRANDISEL